MDCNKDWRICLSLYRLFTIINVYMSCRCVIYTDIYFKSNGKKYKTIKAVKWYKNCYVKYLINICVLYVYIIYVYVIYMYIMIPGAKGLNPHGLAHRWV